MSDESRMGAPSRRGFLTSAGVGAAAAAGAVVLGKAGAAEGAPATTVPPGADEPLVAYVRDAHTGEVAVLIGEREVVVHDLDLAARIARVAH